MPWRAATAWTAASMRESTSALEDAEVGTVASVPPRTESSSREPSRISASTWPAQEAGSDQAPVTRSRTWAGL